MPNAIQVISCEHSAASLGGVASYFAFGSLPLLPKIEAGNWQAPVDLLSSQQRSHEIAPAHLGMLTTALTKGN